MRDQRAEVSLNIAPSEAHASRPIEPREFRILIVGDFGGRGNAAAATNDPPRRVDRDDLNRHLARVAPRLRIDIGGDDIDLAFASLDDFHPDQLSARLRATGAVAAPPPDAARRDVPPSSSAPTRQPDVLRVASGPSLLDDMLDDAGGPTPGDGGSSAPSRTPRRSDELSAFIERAVEPHLVRRDPSTEAQAELAEHEMATRLRAVLHHPRVQALESTWRALDLLVRRLDTDGDLRLYLLDCPRDHVASAIEQLAAGREASDDEPWALIALLHTFDEGNAGADSVARIAMAAKAIDVPCVAAAPASFTGASSLNELDDAERSPDAAPDIYSLIRQSQDGRFLGLTYPRVLMRAPYGRDNPCDTLVFEEMDDPSRHDAYLWGSGATLIALVVGEAFMRSGWAIGGRISPDVGGLPYFTYRRGTETVAKSCAEGIMSERVARWLLSRGLMPVAWIRDTDRVRIIDMRSVTDPPAPLAAPWAGAAPGAAT